uniref:Secretory carrier-associated membrane protein n=1 Tax=Gadus morhua TaxID=8049 RepID=A0A8C4Z7L5_GADMO
MATAVRSLSGVQRSGAFTPLVITRRLATASEDAHSCVFATETVHHRCVGNLKVIHSRGFLSDKNPGSVGDSRNSECSLRSRRVQPFHRWQTSFSGGHGTQSSWSRHPCPARHHEPHRGHPVLRTAPHPGRKNNWPPLPEKFPVGPCFYHDITVDIPVDFQKTVKIIYYLWMFHSGTLFANLIGCMAWFIVDSSRGGDFGLAILWLLLFTPCSFVCWYRPLYGAFRSDSSFRFFIFFFVYVCQVGVYVVQAIGLTGWGASGWISALTCLNTSIAVGIIMILIAGLFTALAVMSLIMFKKVHGMYRTTGASFEKAQQEFASGVMSNKTVQTAAARAAQESFKEQI